MKLDTSELLKNGLRVKLQDQPFAILAALVMRAGEVVPREDLYSKLSSHATYDSNHGLNNAILKIREALDDLAGDSRFIETLRNRGYRFLERVELIYSASANGANRTSAPDSFLLAISQIRQEFLATDSEHKLAELWHRLAGFIQQNLQHPSCYEARLLLDEIESAGRYLAGSERNKAKHRVSLETAAEVFDDPRALSLFHSVDGEEGIWRTLGQIRQKLGPVRRTVLIMVSHSAAPREDEQEEIQIKSARKATALEKKAYDQRQKKTDR